MEDKFTRLDFERLIHVEKIITIFYMEFSKSFCYEGERHDFWEMVYIDKGEMICTADRNRFVLKSGEMTFHKPNEFHNLSGNDRDAPNASILTFQCRSRAMRFFEGKIFRLDPSERALLSEVFAEGLSCYRLEDEQNPLLQNLQKRPDAPVGSSQLTKNLLEVFLIRLYRHTEEVLTKKARRSYVVDGVDVPYDVKELLELLQNNVYGKLTVPDIARRLGKSEGAVKQLFARYKPGGIMRYYNALKIKEAKRLLREGSGNIARIADQLHYTDPQYFAKCFKAHTNMTPSEYKRSIVK